MGIGDKFIATVLTKYKVDIKDAESNVTRLKKKEHERAETVLEDTKSINEGIGSQVAAYAKLGVAAAGIAAAFKTAQASVESYVEQERLAASTSTANMNSLRRASRGLLSDLELRRFANEAMTGSLKLSNSQMELAVKAAFALEASGRPIEQSMERIGQAVREGSVEPLKELGLTITGGGASGTEEGLMSVMGALRKEVNELPSDFHAAGEEIRQSATEAENAFDSLKSSVGGLAADLAPVVSAFAEIVGYIAEIAEKAADLATIDPPSGMVEVFDSQTGKVTFASRHVAMTNPRYVMTMSADSGGNDAMGSSVQSSGFEAPLPGGGSAPAGAAAAGRRGVGNRFTLDALVMPDGFTSVNDGFLDEQMKLLMAKDKEEEEARKREAERRRRDSRISSDVEYVQRIGDEFNALSEKLGIEHKQSILVGLFGTPAEISATAQALEQLANVNESFVGAFGAGVDAIITGSDSFSSAFEKAIAESARAMAVEFSMHAVRHGLFALGSLAFGNPVAATAHGKAAAAYGAGALTVGGLARGLGAGGAGAGAPRTTGTAGVGAAGGGGAVARGPQTTVQLIDETFTDLPPGQREAIYRRRAKRAGVTFEGQAVLNG